MFVLRWPIVLILLILVAVSLFPAVVTTLARTDLIDVGAVSSELEALAVNPTWLEAGLWYGAAIFFLIAAIRLMRRTQGFWMWLIGFALYGGRWALTQQGQEGGLMGLAQSLSLDSFTPAAISDGSPAVQVSMLAIHLLVGLVILIIDGADRAYWDRQGA